MIDDATGIAGIELRIAAILRIGVLVAVALLAVGVGILLAGGRSPLETPWPTLDVSRLPADLVGLRAEGFLWAGLLMTIATPLLRVGASVLGFLVTRERRMAALGVAVLAVLALAVVTSVAAGG